MDALPLPPRPRLDQYERHARELVEVASGDVALTNWTTDWLNVLRHLRGQDTPFAEASFERALSALAARAEAEATLHGWLTLAGAELMIAEAHGFASWDDFAAHLGELADDQASFERAADAVVGGDLGGLQTLLREEPALVRARSARVHRATLLHYVAANGIEDFRQLTPAHAVEVARALLEAGAEVDALADTYEGGNAQTTLNLLVSSAHPAAAGLQPALTEVLLDFGAAVNGVEDDCSPLITALAFGQIDAAETLVRRGARVDNVSAAIPIAAGVPIGLRVDIDEERLLFAYRAGTGDWQQDRTVECPRCQGLGWIRPAI